MMSIFVTGSTSRLAAYRSLGRLREHSPCMRLEQPWAPPRSQMRVGRWMDMCLLISKVRFERRFISYKTGWVSVGGSQCLYLCCFRRLLVGVTIGGHMYGRRVKIFKAAFIVG